MKRRTRIKTTRRSNIGGNIKPTMKVHQVYGIFNDKVPLKKIDVFYKNVLITKDYCKNKYPEIGYKMWNLKECDKLINDHFKKYKRLWSKLKMHDDDPGAHPASNPIMAADFIRYCILHKYGGIYIDCDIHPIGDIRPLFNEPYFFVHWDNDKRKLPYNAVMGSKKSEPLFLDILKECEESYNDRVTKSIYKQRKGRFVFHVTGHYMLKRVLKKNKVPSNAIQNILKIHTKSDGIIEGPKALFVDANASVWYKN